MIIKKTKFQGLLIIKQKNNTDKRGNLRETFSNKALKKKGFHIYPEVSREIINEYRKLGHKQLFLSDPLKFSEILMEKRIIQHENSNENKNKFYFFDRGIPDIIAYLNFKKVKFNPSLLKEIK